MLVFQQVFDDASLCPMLLSRSPTGCYALTQRPYVSVGENTFCLTVKLQLTRCHEPRCSNVERAN